MKKFNLFIIILFMLFYFQPINVNAQNTYIKVGLNKIKNLDYIHIDNQAILSGYGNGSEFVQISNLSSNYGFDIKLLQNYYIKLSNSFSSYDEALSFCNNKNMFPMFENGIWKVYIYGFNSISEAQKYISSNNILGETSDLQNVIGVFSKDKILMAYYNSLNNPFQLKNDSTRLSIDGKLYRNIIQLNILNKKLSAINILDIEEYLYGVVPSEMPSSWHIEALKAQAIAARNYAYSNLGLHSNEGFDVCDTIHCQVYNGITTEKDSTNKAINETKGILAYYKGEIINAVYSSSNGGYSDNSENVWNNKLDYLRAIKDTNEEGGKVWERSFTFDELTNIAENIGNVNEVILESSSVTGRAISLTLIGDSGQKILEKEQIRTFFSKSTGGSLESRNFTMQNGKSESVKTDNTNEIYVLDKNSTHKLDLGNSYFISSNLNVEKAAEKTLMDKNGNINYINSLSGTTNQSNNISNKITSVKRVNSPTIKFYGKGWGHGVGMSQYGANSLAKKGYKYDEILKYYYTGIDVK